jgi:hypothetical protein
MKCPKCHAHNKGNNKYCDKCGASLTYSSGRNFQVTDESTSGNGNTVVNGDQTSLTANGGSIIANNHSRVIINLGDQAVLWTILAFISILIIALGIWYFTSRKIPPTQAPVLSPGEVVDLMPPTLQETINDPNSSPQATQIPENPPMLVDGFQDNSNRWPTGPNVQVVDGAYQINGADRSVLTWNPKWVWNDFELKVYLSFRGDGKKINSAGVLFHVSESSENISYYALLVSSDGRTALGQVSDNNWSQLVPWIEFSGLAPYGNANELTISSKSGTIYVNINGINAITYQGGNNPDKGWIGFMADAGTQAVFDDLEIQSIP